MAPHEGGRKLKAYSVKSSAMFWDTSANVSEGHRGFDSNQTHRHPEYATWFEHTRSDVYPVALQMPHSTCFIFSLDSENVSAEGYSY